MKRRSTLSIAALTMSLIILFAAAALPAQAHHRVNLTGFKFDKDVVVWTNDHTVVIRWQFSWDTIANETGFTLQAKGGGIISTWTTLTIHKVERKDGKTKVQISTIWWQSNFGSMSFRVKAYAPNQVTSYWTEISLSSPPNA